MPRQDLRRFLHVVEECETPIYLLCLLGACWRIPLLSSSFCRVRGVNSGELRTLVADQ